MMILLVIVAAVIGKNPEVDGLIYTSPLPSSAEQSFMIIGLVSVYVHGLSIYIVLAAPVNPVKPVESVTTLVGTQLVFHSFVYAVVPAVPSPNNAYMIFASLGF
jgi:hypothetical protein